MQTHRFSLVVEGAGLLEWANLDALYEAGCGLAAVPKACERERIPVAVREEPRGVDTVPGRLAGWHPNDVVGERIDGDIREARRVLKTLTNIGKVKAEGNTRARRYRLPDPTAC